MELVLLCLAAVVGGAINSVAGGGTLITFPALNAILGDSDQAAVIANATNTVALCPGSIAAMWGYRRELWEVRQWIKVLIVPSLVGGLAGALLLTQLPAELFQMLVPWLILAAAVLFALQPSISKWTGIGKPHGVPTRSTLIGVVVFQFLVAVYGGYFGAGIGILMLAALAFMGIDDIHAMNALKTLFAAAINGVAVVEFIRSDSIHWTYGLIMAVAAIAGGYYGATLARSLNRHLVRKFVVVLGLVLAAYYFWREFLA